MSFKAVILYVIISIAFVVAVEAVMRPLPNPPTLPEETHLELDVVPCNH